MESEFPNNMNIRSVVLPKKMGLANFGTDWLTEESKTCIPLPSSCVGYESGQMIYSGCSRQKSHFPEARRQQTDNRFLEKLYSDPTEEIWVLYHRNFWSNV